MNKYAKATVLAAFIIMSFLIPCSVADDVCAGENIILSGAEPAFKEVNPEAYDILVTASVLGYTLFIVLIYVLFALFGKNRELIRAQKSLHTAEELLEKENLLKAYQEKIGKDMQNLIDAFPMPIFIFDPRTMETLYSNDAAAEIFGYRNCREMTGLNIFGLLFAEGGPNGADGSVFLNEITSSVVPLKRETCISVENREYNDMAVICMNIEFLGIPAVIVIIQDVSAEKKRAEMLLKMAEREKEASELKNRFIVNMSHEIGTPMNAILGLSDIAIANAGSIGDSIDVFKKINLSAKSLLSMVNDIMDFSKMEAGGLIIDEYQFSIEDVLRDALRAAEKRADNKDIRIIPDISMELPDTVRGDKTRLRQILNSILDNSAKFTNKGHIMLRVVPKCGDESGRVVIIFEIADTGIGLTYNQIEKIYEPFIQFQDVRAHEGTGLGLAITKKLVSLMGGEINVNSVLGEGTAVTVSIPFKQSENWVSLSQKCSQQALENIRVLVVDDYVFSRNTYNSFLSSLKILPDFATGPAEAEDTVKRLSEDGGRFNIAIIDLSQPENGGSEAAQVISGISPETKLLFIEPFIKRQADTEKLGIRHKSFINKPFTPTALTGKMHEVLNIDTVSGVKEGSNAVASVAFEGAGVLLVEDNPINQEVALGLLAIYGINPVVAENGEEAIMCLEERHFDLVLMDIYMPVMTGHEAAMKIRESAGNYKNIPIVAMTANATKDEIEKCFAEGMNGYVVKPVEQESLYKELTKWLPHEKVDKIETHVAPSRGLNIDGIDVQDGLKRFVNKIDRYEKALKSFASDLRDTVSELECFALNEDYEQAQRVAHKIKGVSGNLGAKQLFGAASELEQQLVRGIYDKDILDEFIKQANEVEFNIKNAFNVTGDAYPDSVDAAGNETEAVSLLTRLNRSVREFDPAASENIAAELKKKQWGPLEGEIKAICKLIDEYDYAEAESIIEKLLRKRGE